MLPRRARRARDGDAVAGEEQVIEHGELGEDAVAFDNVDEARAYDVSRAGTGEIAAGKVDAAGPGEQA